MYRTVMWASDGSDEATAALAEAVRLLEPGGRIVAAHVDERFLGGRVGGEPVRVDEAERQEVIRARVEELQEAGFDTDLLMLSTHHSPADELAHAAEELGVDAIVCGSRGAGAVSALFLGSVAHRLLHVATVPVLVVPARNAVPSASRPVAVSGARARG